MSHYDEVEIQDMRYDESTGVYHYECPCGDRFEISESDLLEGIDIAECPSCSLTLKVIYEREYVTQKQAERESRQLI